MVDAVQVGRQAGARRGTVGEPELLAVDAVVRGEEEPAGGGDGAMEALGELSTGKPLSGTVPTAVPSVFQTCRWPAASLAVNRRAPPRGMGSAGTELHVPGQRSRTRRVPAAVPSVTQSSSPC